MNHLAIAEALAEAILAGDATSLERLISPEATAWQNTTGVEQQRDEFLPGFAAFASLVRDLRFENVRRTATPTGFVEQHTTCFIAPWNDPVANHMCFIATVADGVVTRIEEYFDSAAFSSPATAQE